MKKHILEPRHPSYQLFESKMDFVSLTLVIITVALMLWHKWGMDTSIVLSPKKSTGAWVESDSLDAGNSKATLKIGNAFSFSCNISDESVHDYPYCNLLIPLTNNEKGVNLTEYDSIYLTLEHNSTAQDTLRIFLNSHYSAPFQFNTKFKMNLYELDVKSGLNTYKIALKDFVVPYWWVCQSNDSNALVDLTNVKEFMLSTGKEIQGREVDVNLYKVQLNKKWIKKENLYQFLLKGWIGWIIIILFWRYYTLRVSNNNLFTLFNKLQKNNNELGEKARLLKQSAITDPLTGLLNRLGIQEVIDECIYQYTTKGETFSVLMIDVDYFKRINDVYGHDIGDTVLTQVARCINKRCRQSDFSARWGGEEFLVVCRNTTGSNALQFAENLREDMCNLAWGHGDKVTASIGVAEANIENIKNTIKSADIALYQAKSSGRNCSVLYRES